MVEPNHRYWHRRGYLPHFDAGNTTQSITFRLADSLPLSLRVSLVQFDKQKRRKHFERMMDKGYGSCILRETACAEIVCRVLMHFDGVRYRMLAWVVMPNHVHVLVEQIEGWPLAAVVQGWKSVSARAIGFLNATKGSIWAADYFDRFIRDAEHFTNTVCYIEENPVKAGLVGNAQDWPFSSRGRPLGSWERGRPGTQRA
jgi:REP element-mobilizing transposase RayT